MKVSVITATWNRRNLLNRAIRSLGAQTYTDWEHIIISDGPDPALYKIFKWHQCKIVELGRNWHNASGGINYGGVPKYVANYLAGGDYIAYLDDDNEYCPHHLKTLVDKIEEGYGFVYSKMDAYNYDGLYLNTVGDGKPRHTSIDTNIIMHRWDLIRIANWQDNVYADDWQLVEKWLNAGVKWAWVDAVTVKYHARPLNTA